MELITITLQKECENYGLQIGFETKVVESQRNSVPRSYIETERN
jgi:hypothetical protein